VYGPRTLPYSVLLAWRGRWRRARHEPACLRLLNRTAKGDFSHERSRSGDHIGTSLDGGEQGRFPGQQEDQEAVHGRMPRRTTWSCDYYRCALANSAAHPCSRPPIGRHSAGHTSFDRCPGNAASTAPPPGRTSGPATAAAPTAAGQFSTETQAKARCPGDTIVWVNLDSKIYHFVGTRNCGTTKSGAYMCERDATAAGSRAGKNEKHP
jgi:hypothetical protein